MTGNALNWTFFLLQPLLSPALTSRDHHSGVLPFSLCHWKNCLSMVKSPFWLQSFLELIKRLINCTKLIIINCHCVSHNAWIQRGTSTYNYHNFVYQLLKVAEKINIISYSSGNVPLGHTQVKSHLATWFTLNSPMLIPFPLSDGQVPTI